ncbi:MAG: ATPase, T2SS/T4P/T4SS family [Candidatus Micrarchaeia archaeon]
MDINKLNLFLKFDKKRKINININKDNRINNRSNSYTNQYSQFNEESELTFLLDFKYPDKIIRSDTAKHRVIGKQKNEIIYSIFAVNLNNNDIKIAKNIKANVINNIINNGINIKKTPEFISNVYSMCLDSLVNIQTNENKDTIAYLIAHDIVGYGPISILLEDAEEIEEIEINAPTSNIVIYHSIYGRCTTNLKFVSAEAFKFTINRLIENTNKELNSNNPIIDAQLNDGSRLHAQIAPYAVNNGIASIRINNGKGYDLKKLIGQSPIMPKIFAYLWLSINTKQNVIIAGAPAAGKTSLLRSIYPLIPKSERIITVEEDSNELKFNTNFINVVSLQGYIRNNIITIRDQVINALHLRPERLIVGEIRGSEAKEIFAGANFGIPFMTTMHSDLNAIAILNRLQSAPMNVESFNLNMLDLGILLKQDAKGRRYIDSIVEYKWKARNEIENKSDEYQLNFIVKNGLFINNSLTYSKVISKFAKENLLNTASTLSEFNKRSKFLSEINSNKNRMKVINEYIDSYWWYDVKN